MEWVVYCKYHYSIAVNHSYANPRSDATLFQPKTGIKNSGHRTQMNIQSSSFLEGTLALVLNLRRSEDFCGNAKKLVKPDVANVRFQHHYKVRGLESPSR